MRIILLLIATLVGGVVGLFAAGYAYDLWNPKRSASTHPVLANSVDQFGRSRIAQADVGEALDRHQRRYNWFVAGAITGAAVGFLSTVLVYRAEARSGPTPKIEVRDRAEDEE